MGIPVSPALIANAQVFQNDYSAVPVNVCKPDPVYPPKAVSFQFLFNNNAAWFVNMQQGLPPFSFVAAMYIDATQSSNTILVIFPDTGYQVPVEAGKTLLCPVLTGKNLPQFYVVTNSGGIPTSDVCNLILLNFYIPAFAGG